MTQDFGDMPALAPDFAAERFTVVFSESALANDLGSHLTCTEVNHMADVLHSNGDAPAAQWWLNAHFRECDDIDDHDVYSASVFKLPQKAFA